MSLFYVFTIDGDWDEYFYPKLPESRRQPDKHKLNELVKREMEVASVINGRVLHFVHSSPVTRDFFMKPEFVKLWQQIEARGGSVGVHCHEEDLYKEFHFNDQARMEKAVGDLTESLLKNGLAPISYRGGHLAFSEKVVPILEENGLFLDFSCDPGRHLFHGGKLVADWRGAPDNYYRLSYEDHRKAGQSKVFEIPLGKVGNHALYLDTTSLFNVWRVARALAKRDGLNIVSVLSHTYEMPSFWKRLKIKLALTICKKYGKFISDREALEIINHEGRVQS